MNRKRIDIAVFAGYPFPLDDTFEKAVRWARGEYGINGPVTSWQDWRGRPMESVMRIVYYMTDVTKRDLAARFGMSAGCTAALNASIGPDDIEGHVASMIAEGFDFDARCTLCGHVLGEGDPELDPFEEAFG